ncbi:MAG TPA: SDR family oxidoreductase [Tepidisphaeraceae bacterium]|jgi:NAD(P)-dependent dehydrogenase (short-subunit alcohol dehydrogenase family)
MRLKDKVIIVTGSTQGVGEAIARRFVAEGAKLVIHGLERDLGERVLADLHPNAILHINDLVRPESAQELVDVALRHFGHIDGLVNNAARPLRATLEQTDAATFDYVINLNLRAPLLLIRAALPHLLASRGSILNIGSVNAYCGAANLVPYSISKGGLMTLTRNVADAYCTTGLRVNQINLGWVLTENEKRIMDAGGLPPDWWNNPPREGAPTGRLMLPQEVATAAVYWIGDESRPVSGSVLELNQFPIIGRNTVKEKS